MADFNDLHELLDRFATGTLETDKSKIEDLRGRQIYFYRRFVSKNGRCSGS